jgi:hypothetical protein
MIEILLQTYFGANLFFAGYYLADNYQWQDTKTEKIICILWVIATVFFGLIYICFVPIIALIIVGLEMLNEYFQITFWFTFYLTKKWNKFDTEKLRQLNVAANKKTDKTLKERIYKRCVRLLNKRNNYTYVEQEIEF